MGVGKSLSDEVFEYLMRWYEQTGEPMPLAFASRRFGKRARAHGVSLEDLILSDSRFASRLKRSGGRIVAPSAQIEIDYPEATHKFWMGYGVPL